MINAPRRFRGWVRASRLFRVAPPLFSAPQRKFGSAAALLHIPTSDGSGEACHPSVAHIAEGFGGYRFWMANTPYRANLHKLENPELFGSHDGLFWEVPDGISNPLVAPPEGDERHYNSDPCLLHHRDRLLLYFRTSDERPDARRDSILMMSSSDGRNWSEPKRVLEDATGRLLLCPTVRAIDGELHMWTVERAGGAHLTICRRVSPDGEHWSGPQATEMVWSRHPLEPWHIDVIRHGEKLILAFSGRVPGRRGTQLFYGATGNGEKWDVLGPLDTGPCAFEGGKAYKPSLVVTGEGPSTVRLYTSSQGVDGKWYTALRPYTLPPP